MYEDETVEAEWVTFGWVARKLGITHQHAGRLAKAGEFGAIIDVNRKLGSSRPRLRVRRDAVEKWTFDRTVTPS